MAFICQSVSESVCHSICNTIVSAPYHMNLLMIFIKFCSNVPLSETVCRTHELSTQTQGQGHSSIKLMGFTLEFRVRSISPEPFQKLSFNFIQMSQ